MLIDKAIVDFESIHFTEKEAFEDDVELAGSSVKEIESALGIPLKKNPKKAHKAYLELLLKLKDSRHGG